MAGDKDVNRVPEARESGDTAGQDAPRADANTPPSDGQKVQPRKSILDRFKARWVELGLNVPTLMAMAKGGLPPVIVFAMYQSDSVSRLFPTLGYLLGIISLLGTCMMPRAKFVQTMIFNVIGTCIGIAMGLLASYSAVRARETSPSSPPEPGSRRPGYNSSASVVLAVWLFFQIYLINSFRAKYPQFMIPTVLYAILANVVCSYASGFPSIAYAVTFNKELLEVFLLGLGVATGVHFLIFPMTVRKIVFAEFVGSLGLIRGALKAELAYFHSMADPTELERLIAKPKDGTTAPIPPQAEAVKAARLGLQNLHGKLHGDIALAKRETAFGYLRPHHLKEMYELQRKIVLPVIGLSAIVGIFERLQELNVLTEGSPGHDYPQETEEDLRERIKADWSDYMDKLHDTLQAFVDIIGEGIDHILLTMKLKKPPKTKRKHKASATGEDDVEGDAGSTQPGSAGFTAHYEAQIDKLHHGKEETLRLWSERKGITLPKDFFEHPSVESCNLFKMEEGEEYVYHQRKQRQLYLLLYLEYLVNAVARSVLVYIQYAEGLQAEGVFSKKRFIFPGRKALKKMVRSWFKHEGSPEEDHTGGDIGGNTQNVQLGSAYNGRKDPEHLPPTNWVERAGNYVRMVPRFLRSPESVFGFRVACATLSIAIVAFVRQTQLWYVHQRGLWALIMVTISMNPTAGASLFSYVLRVAGTIVAMLVSWLIWYIPDQKTAGILVFLWFFTALCIYIPLKMPQFTVVGMITMVTITLIVGYQVEVRKVGRAEATANDQPYYPIYEFAPYRLATVLAGLGAAFIWTYFPYPISEHSQIRKGLSSALYLLANYYSVVHELSRSRIRGNQGDPSVSTSPGQRLEKYRVKLFSKLMLSLTGLRTYAGFLRYEIPVGGKFPKKQYDEIIRTVSSLVTFISLLSYASNTFTQDSSREDSLWSDDFRRVLDGAVLTSREITSLLSLLSSSISSGTPLPPYLQTPQPYQLSQKMEALDKEILGIRHINEPCYAAFAVMQISTRCIVRDLDTLLKNVKEIVGELDFSFHVISTADSSSETTLTSRAADIEKVRSKQD